MRPEMLLAAPETEQWVIGLVMAHGHMAPKAVARLNARHFTVRGSRAVWDAIQTRVANGKNVSVPAVFGDIRQNEHAVEFMRRLIDSPVEGWRERHFDDLCEQLEMAEARRRIFHLGQKIVRLAEEDFPDPVGLEVSVQAEVWNVTKYVGSQDTVALSDAAAGVVSAWERQLQGEEPHERIGVGFGRTLDWRLGGGLNKGDLHVLAGRPHMGKTALALSMSLNVAADDNRRVLYFSPEMDAQALATRAIQTFGISTEDALVPTDESVRKAHTILKLLKERKIDIVPDRAPTVEDIVAKSRAYALEHTGLSLIVIDHLGEIRVPRHNRNEATVIGENVQKIRAMAGDLNVPVLLLSQLNRNLERRDNKRPVMSDLRDSGRIEELADAIMFAYREAVYDEDMPEDLRGVSEIIFAKARRTGRMGTELIEFVPQYVRFQEAMPDTLRHYAEHIENSLYDGGRSFARETA